MKKVIVILLAAVMAFGLLACGGEEKSDAPKVEGLQIGFAKANITPDYSCPMGGYGNNSSRLSSGLLDYLYFSVVAATGENGETVLLCAFDSMNLPVTPSDTLRSAISAATNIPVSHIFIAASHSHSTPDPAYEQYLSDLVNHASQAAKDALADRSAATIQVGTSEVEGMNWVRHYIMQDGTYAGPNFGNTNQPYKGHATEADGELQVVRFVRAAEDKKDVVLVNWQAHPTLTGGIDKYDISSDFLGPLRDHVNATMDVETVYFNGAAGNLTPNSYISGETFSLNHREYGKKMGEYVVQTMANMTEISGTDVKTVSSTVIGTCDHTEDELLDIALQVRDLFNTNGNDRVACSAFSQPYGIEGIYHADGIIARSKRGKTEDVGVSAVSIGDLGFAVAPYEMTDTNGMQIKDDSPFAMTFIVGYANGFYNYIIADSQYDYPNYEFQTRRYTRGIGEEMAESFLGMLKELHG